MSINVNDLFCGGGGFSTGFQMTGKYNVLAGIDKETFLKQTFEYNHGSGTFFNYDIRKDVPLEIKGLNIDLVIGSPPCQGFSDARGTRYQLDEKNDLVIRYFEWIKDINPPVAIMENVKGMTTIGSAWRSIEDPDKPQTIDFMDLLAQYAHDIGYKFKFDVLNSKYFGVPQERERVFCVLVRNDIGIPPSLPRPVTNGKSSKKLTSFLTNETKEDLEYNIPIPPITVQEAFSGLIEPQKYTNDLVIDELRPIKLTSYDKKNHIYYQKILDFETIYNHIARYSEDEEEIFILDHIPEGKTYRSDRRGDKHVGVWDIFQDSLTKEECTALKSISILRTRNNVKTKKGEYTEGAVPYKLHLEKEFDKKLLDNLVNNGWLQYTPYCGLTEKSHTLLAKGSSSDDIEDIKILKKVFRLTKDEEYDTKKGGIPVYKLGLQWNTLKRLEKEKYISITDYKEEYDLTSKSGLRGKYSRLGLNEQSRTLMTGFANIRDIVHPTQSRGLSLREGARIMSFPDSFRFFGSFSQISLQVGNAVAPLVAYAIADHIYKTYYAKLPLLQSV